MVAIFFHLMHSQRDRGAIPGVTRAHDRPGHDSRWNALAARAVRAHANPAPTIYSLSPSFDDFAVDSVRQCAIVVRMMTHTRYRTVYSDFNHSWGIMRYDGRGWCYWGFATQADAIAFWGTR